MSYQIRRFTEHLGLQLVKVIASVVDGTFPATYIDVSKYSRFAFLIATGAGDDTSVACKVVQATAAAGTGSKDVTGAALTATSLASASGANKWAMIEVDNEHLDIANDFGFVALNIAATGGAATTMAVFFIGIEPITRPPTFGTDKAEIVYVDG